MTTDRNIQETMQNFKKQLIEVVFKVYQLKHEINYGCFQIYIDNDGDLHCLAFPNNKQDEMYLLFGKQEALAIAKKIISDLPKFDENIFVCYFELYESVIRESKIRKVLWIRLEEDEIAKNAAKNLCGNS